MNIIKRVFLLRQSSIGGAAFILMSTVIVSRMLGLFRDRLLAGVYSPEELGIYFASFRLPNMLFDLLVMGVLSAAFIPVFTRLLTQKKEKIAWRMASIIANYTMGVFFIGSVTMFLFARQLCSLFAPGLSEKEIDLMVDFTRTLLFFQALPLIVGNVLTGILQSYQFFFIPAIAPVLYNLGTIIGIVILSPFIGLWAPIAGVSIGAFLFLCVQIPLLFLLRFRYYGSFDTKTEGVREVGILMIPRAIGLGASQIETTLDLILASMLGAKMITVFHFAQHLQQLPVGLFGVTIAQAAFPTLSRSSAQGSHRQFRQSVINAIHQILFFVLPISVCFIVLRVPITRLVFGSSEYDWEATILTAKTLAMFSLSLFAQSIIHVLTRAFYAICDTKTPMLLSIAGIVMNMMFSVLFIFVFQLPVWGLGLSTSIAMSAQVLLLYYVLQKRIGLFSFVDTFVTPMKMVCISFIMGIIMFLSQRLFDELIFDTTRTINVFLFTSFLTILGGVAYLFLSWVFGVDQFYRFARFIKKLKTFQHLPFHQGDQEM